MSNAVPPERKPLSGPQEYQAAATYDFGGRVFTAAQVVAGLAPFLSDERVARIAEIAATRTRTIVPVLEGLYDRGNVSAVLRSAEGLGYQTVHVIDSSPFFKEAKRVTQGAQKWLDIYEWPSTGPCIQDLRAQGYQIAVAHLEGAMPLRALDPLRKTALVFGNEHAGPSEEALAAADLRVIIPMTGFTQSFNISVAAAICLYDLAQRRADAMGRHGDLDEAERVQLMAAFTLRAVPHAAAILRRLPA